MRWCFCHKKSLVLSSLGLGLRSVFLQKTSRILCSFWLYCIGCSVRLIYVVLLLLWCNMLRLCIRARWQRLIGCKVCDLVELNKRRGQDKTRILLALIGYLLYRCAIGLHYELWTTTLVPCHDNVRTKTSVSCWDPGIQIRVGTRTSSNKYSAPEPCAGASSLQRNKIDFIPLYLVHSLSNGFLTMGRFMSVKMVLSHNKQRDKLTIFHFPCLM